MLLKPRSFALLFVSVAAAASTAVPPVAVARPLLKETEGGASAVIEDLQAQGYNVVINWISGYDTKPLSICWVTSINNPGNTSPSPGTFTTVYVDVRCPNHDYGD